MQTAMGGAGYKRWGKAGTFVMVVEGGGMRLHYVVE